MDIDLLGAVGGLVLIPDCMATLKTSSISESSSKSQNPFLLFLGLIFIFLVLVHSSDPSIHNSTMVSNVSTQNLIPHPSHESSPSSSSSSSSTMNLHPRKSKNSHSSPSPSTSREFEAGEHEVPSGPNPISN